MKIILKLLFELIINKITKISLIIPSILFIIIFLTSCEQEKPGSLEVTLGLDRNSNVNYTISNNGNSDLLFLDYDTPINGHNRSYFKITNENGDEVPYIGRLVSIDPDSSHWTSLKAGESIKISVDLLQAYGFSWDMGRYSISYVSSINIKDGSNYTEKIDSEKQDFSSAVDLEQVNVISNEIEVEIINTENSGSMAKEDLRGCSSSELAEVNESSNQAEDMTMRSITYMEQNGMDSLWNTWWGSDNSGRYEYIMNGHVEILGSFEKNWNYICPSSIYCKNGANAWVYANTPYKVWLCSRFFNSHDSQSQGSILIHESSHWYEILGTDDYTYGESNCKKLAQNSPSKAKNNADNYRFFILKTFSETVKPPTAIFTYSINELRVQFNDNSTDPENQIASRKWYFGDNKTSIATNPSHTYSQAGTYTVKLTVTDQGGLADSYSKSVTVKIVKYTLVVNDGNGDGQYSSGQIVTISADSAPTGKIFDKWVINSGQASIADKTKSSTTLTIPSGNAEITASYMEVLQSVGCGSILDSI